MKTKEELKTLYAEYKRGVGDDTFTSVLYDKLKGALKDIGFEISLNCGSIFSGKKKKKTLIQLHNHYCNSRKRAIFYTKS